MRPSLIIASALLATLLSTPTNSGPNYLVPDLVPVPEVMEDSHVVEQGGRQLLRFSSGIANIGDGPMEVKGKKKQGKMLAFQHFYKGGKSGTKLRPGKLVRFGEFEYHAEHHHWHLIQVAQYRLLNTEGETVSLSDKISFCLVDTQPVSPALPGAPPIRHYLSCEGKLNAKKLKAGISRGWVDIYGAFLPDQWVDVTDLPAGTYTLQVTVNPLGTIQEKSLDNNTTSIEVTLP